MDRFVNHDVNAPRRMGAPLGCALLAVVGCLTLTRAATAEFPRFVSHEIDRVGSKMGQTSLVDVDRDGDLDWVAGCNRGDVWWFEHVSADRWVRHLIGGGAGTEVGGTALDVDGDGWVDQVSGSTWYRNPRGPARLSSIPTGPSAQATTTWPPTSTATAGWTWS